MDTSKVKKMKITLNLAIHKNLLLRTIRILDPYNLRLKCTLLPSSRSSKDEIISKLHIYGLIITIDTLQKFNLIRSTKYVYLFF